MSGRITRALSTTNNNNMNESHSCFIFNRTEFTLECFKYQLTHDLKFLLLTLLFSVLIVIDVSANLIVIFSILYERMRKRVDVCFLSNAIADLLMGLVIMPLTAIYTLFGHFPFGQLACFVWNILDFTTGTVSMLHIAYISYDRYLCVCKPISKYKQNMMSSGTSVGGGGGTAHPLPTINSGSTINLNTQHHHDLHGHHNYSTASLPATAFSNSSNNNNHTTSHCSGNFIKTSSSAVNSQRSLREVFSINNIPTSVSILFIWLFGASVWIPTILYFRSKEINKPDECIFETTPIIIIPHSLVVYYLPILLTLIFYTKTILILNKKISKKKPKKKNSMASCTSSTKHASFLIPYSSVMSTNLTMITNNDENINGIILNNSNIQKAGNESMATRNSMSSLISIGSFLNHLVTRRRAKRSQSRPNEKKASLPIFVHDFEPVGIKSRPSSIQRETLKKVISENNLSSSNANEAIQVNTAASRQLLQVPTAVEGVGTVVTKRSQSLVEESSSNIKRNSILKKPSISSNNTSAHNHFIALDQAGPSSPSSPTIRNITFKLDDEEDEYDLEDALIMSSENREAAPPLLPPAIDDSIDIIKTCVDKDVQVKVVKNGGTRKMSSSQTTSSNNNQRKNSTSLVKKIYSPLASGSKRERVVTYKLGLILFTFIFSWLPFCMLWPLMSICSYNCVNENLYMFSFWLAYLNSTFTPIILLYSNTNYRKAILVMKNKFLTRPILSLFKWNKPRGNVPSHFADHFGSALFAASEAAGVDVVNRQHKRSRSK